MQNTIERYTHSVSKLVPQGIEYSEHAKVRKQQRGIKDWWVSIVLDYGNYEYQNGKHTYSISLNKASLKSIKRTFGKLVDIEKLRRLYVIMSEDSVVITCAYR